MSLLISISGDVVMLNMLNMRTSENQDENPEPCPSCRKQIWYRHAKALGIHIQNSSHLANVYLNSRYLLPASDRIHLLWTLATQCQLRPMSARICIDCILPSFLSTLRTARTFLDCGVSLCDEDDKMCNDYKQTSTKGHCT